MIPNMDSYLILHRLLLLSNYKQVTSLEYKTRRFKKYKPEGICKCCKIRDANVKHHMIQLQNGGQDVWWNRIDICNQCHEKIHPWINVDRQEEKMNQSFKHTIG